MSQNAAWFPTIFPDKCDGCITFQSPKCVDFCPNDVLAIKDDKVIVINPQNCVFGCTSCESLCHRKAIIFPGASRVQTRIPSRDKGLLRKTECRGCGKVFWTSRDTDLCFDCEKKSVNRVPHPISDEEG